MKLKLPLLLTCLLALALPLQSATREEQWQQVESAIQAGQPQTAIEALQPIIDGALADEAYAEAVKAIARRIILEGNIQGNKPEEKIRLMEAEIAAAPDEMKPVLQTLLAHWYWHYFQNNRWRFMQRTATSEPPGEDFTTWDLRRLFAEIDTHFQASLSNEDFLKSTAVADWDELLEAGTLPDDHRPTLYDFLAHEALAFYSAGEQVAMQPEEPFEVPADGPIFETVDAFLNWEPAGPTEGTVAPALRAVNLYQALLRFHQEDDNPTAFIDVDIARLVWGSNVAFGETQQARFREALERIVNQWADHPLSAIARFHWAASVRGEDDLVRAREIALRGAEIFPESDGGRMCRNLVTEIESKSFEVISERVWNEPWPAIRVRYRNLTNLHFRAVPYDWEDFLDRRRNRPRNLSQQERRLVLDRPVAKSWSVTLPATPDYQERIEELEAPDDLEAGFYFIVASHDPEFRDTDNQVKFTDVWVSELALIIRPRAGQIEGFVLEADSGRPLPGAEVRAWQLDNQGNRVARPALDTDEHGFFSIREDTNRGWLIRVRHEGRELASEQEYASHWREHDIDRRQTVFFTDRSIYRPGQTIQYKGICLEVDTARDNYQTLAGRAVTVAFVDPNNNEIARREHRCNAFGSFSGSFTAPRDRVTGAMRIYVVNGPQGATHLSVEEYKRPKFEVTLDAPKEAPRLDETVALSGKAMSYTGAPVDGARVRYRVVREVRWPYWWGWHHRWRMRGISESQEITHGFTETDVNGAFTIEFEARPDPKVPEEEGVSFSFAVHADVTDTAGETRSDQRRLQAGFVALSARIDAEEWQTPDEPVELRVNTTTLDGEPQSAEGVIKVHRLQQPDTVHRPYMGEISSYWPGPTTEDPDLSNPEFWPLGEMVAEQGFTTAGNGLATNSFELDVGAYRAVMETRDRFGKSLTVRHQLLVVDPDADNLDVKVPHLLTAPKWSVEPGEEFVALWGTGYEEGRAFVEIEHRHRFMPRFQTGADGTQERIVVPVTEAMRGGFTVHVTYVRENRAYLERRHVDVPWSNKNLELGWEHFTSKLEPAVKETWTAVVSGPDAEKAAAEMVATLYDASLDAFQPHRWMERFGLFRRDYTTAQPDFQNGTAHFVWMMGRWADRRVTVRRAYRHFPRDLIANIRGYRFLPGAMFVAQADSNSFAEGALPASAVAEPARAADAGTRLGIAARGVETRADGVEKAGEQSSEHRPDLDQITARKNLDETAFFFPQLTSDSNGVVRMTFTMPEALTRWRFMGFAHDSEMRSGFLEGETVTAKDLMVQPNPPRFLREGDELEFTVKVFNRTPTRQSGTVRLTFRTALDDDPADANLGNDEPEQSFDIPANESRGYSWRIAVPDGIGFLTYKAVGSTGRVSDGEEGYLPVLSRRVLVTESIALPIRGPATNQFNFTKLSESGTSDTLRHQNLVVQMSSNPSWYAVMALPYLMEFPHECSEQVFNRLYANALARHIANADPKIRRIFDQWKGTDALDSPLEKNEDLKSVALEETPWLRQAKSESQARRDVGILFDANRLDYETSNTLRKLGEMQLGDGSWPWFPGGRGNDYMTLYIVTGFGRMRHLGTDVPVDAAVRALNRLDGWITERYRRIVEDRDKEDNHLTPHIALYLYGRSFFLNDQPVAPEAREAVDFFLAQAKRHWLGLGHRLSQGHLALALKRFGDLESAKAIMTSIKQRSVTDEELGRFWRDTERSWWWYRAPIETQALMIEAFDEVMNDAEAAEECRVWLLKQKQTQNWKTTKATADAVFGLLLRGMDILASDARVEVEIGGQTIEPEQVEAGTGFYEERLGAGQIEPRLGSITVRKEDRGVAWGSMHWQYLEDIAKVTPHEGTPLKLTKRLYVKEHTPRGPELKPVSGPVGVGDELVVRIELRTDRDMEYVHLKDQRGSGTEPLNVLSRYRYQDGLAYYESTRDTASHFFIDYLPKGTYVFEYSSHVVHKGGYQSGMAEIQCMYAPEFNSHSESLTIRVE